MFFFVIIKVVYVNLKFQFVSFKVAIERKKSYHLDRTQIGEYKKVT